MLYAFQGIYFILAVMVLWTVFLLLAGISQVKSWSASFHLLQFNWKAMQFVPAV